MEAREALLAWYDGAARDLPWRRTKDPYAIWVSEIMLQQTRVETVIPYYERFLARFPTPRALADATEDEVLSHWSGLGYYRRARLLHAGVKEVVADYGGLVPEDPAARLGLKGVGRYTAGAIGSIAFDRPEPIVDGNVARVLCRLHLIETPLGRADTEKRLWAEAEVLAEGPRPGDLNQALMELGATVCTPKAPKCAVCPLRARCRAHAEERTSDLPVPRKKKKPKVVPLVAVVAERGAEGGSEQGPGCWLVRGEGSLFGGLFGVPMAEGESPVDAARALEAHGLVGAPLAAEPARVTHVLTHRRLEVRVYRALEVSGQENDGRRCFDRAAMRDVGVSTLTRKILAAADPSQLDLFSAKGR